MRNYSNSLNRNVEYFCDIARRRFTRSYHSDRSANGSVNTRPPNILLERTTHAVNPTTSYSVHSHNGRRTTTNQGTGVCQVVNQIGGNLPSVTRRILLDQSRKRIFAGRDLSGRQTSALDARHHGAPISCIAADIPAYYSPGIKNSQEETPSASLTIPLQARSGFAEISKTEGSGKPAYSLCKASCCTSLE